ncbi:MAG: class I SAM-dependent methyltransferase, partial [Actinomycetes bacterium]
MRCVDSSGLLRRGGSVFEYGSPHGGSWLDLLTARGLHVAPADEPADVVLDCFGLMHAANQRAALAQRVARLADDGVLLLQFHSLAAILRGAQWNAVRHGHFAYYSTPALLSMLAVAGLGADTAWRFDLYGGTVLLAARRAGQPDRSVLDLGREEVAAGVRSAQRVASLQQDATRSTDALQAFLQEAKTAGRMVLGYGAASRAVVLLNRAGIGPDLLPAVADAAPGKHDRRIPGVGIPVVTPEQLVTARPDLVLLFVPDLLEEVRRILPGVELSGGRWVLL